MNKMRGESRTAEEANEAESICIIFNALISMKLSSFAFFRFSGVKPPRWEIFKFKAEYYRVLEVEIVALFTSSNSLIYLFFCFDQSINYL